MKRLIKAMTLQEAYDIFGLSMNDNLDKDNLMSLINNKKAFLNQTWSKIEKEKAEKELEALYLILDNLKMKKQARTSIQFDNDLQPFLINGTDLLPLSDEYINLAKKMLTYIPILPTNERVYDLALYLSMYNIENIENDFNKYLQLCKQYLVNQNIINDKTQTTKYAKKLIASLDNLFEIQQEIDVQLKKKYGDPVYIGPQDKLYTYNQIADEYENYGDDYYSLDEWAVMNGYRKFNIYDKKFTDKNYVFNWCRKNHIFINNEIIY